MRKKFEFVNLVTGLKVTLEEYEGMSAEDKSEYDRITSSRKAKAVLDTSGDLHE